MSKISSNYIDKMFPVSFERPNKYDRILSEENLRCWIKGAIPNPVDTRNNSLHSYVITEEFKVGEDFEFFISGYYVRMTGDWTSKISDDDTDVYAVIEVSQADDDIAQSLTGSKDPFDTDGDFHVLDFQFVERDGEPNITNPETQYKLHILNKRGSKFFIPQTSLSEYSVVDGGEIF